MIIAATNDTDVNVRVYEDGEARGMLVNVVDVPPLCNFILPAITRSGPIAIAISTAMTSATTMPPHMLLRPARAPVSIETVPPSRPAARMVTTTMAAMDAQ